MILVASETVIIVFVALIARVAEISAPQDSVRFVTRWWEI